MGRDEIVPHILCPGTGSRTGRSSGAAGNRTRVPRPRDRSSTSVVCGLISDTGRPANGGGRHLVQLGSPAPRRRTGLERRVC